VILNRPLLRYLREAVRRELQHIRHDAEIHLQRFQRLVRILTAQRLELVHLEALLFGCGTYRIGLRTGLFRRAEHRRHFVAALQKRFEHCFTKVLLSNYCNFHLHFRQW
jgi:hypothetical protein